MIHRIFKTFNLQDFFKKLIVDFYNFSPEIIFVLILHYKIGSKNNSILQKLNFLYVLSINLTYETSSVFFCWYQNAVRVSIKIKKVFLLGKIMFLLVSLAQKKLLRLGKERS